MKSDPILVLIGGRIRAQRKAQGLTQEELADRAKVHHNFIGMIERGERNVGVKTLVAIAKGMSVSPAIFFDDLAF